MQRETYNREKVVENGITMKRRTIEIFFNDVKN